MTIEPFWVAAAVNIATILVLAGLWLGKIKNHDATLCDQRKAIKAIGDKLDFQRERSERRYRMMIQTMTAISVALSNPHPPSHVTALLAKMAEDNDDAD